MLNQLGYHSARKKGTNDIDGLAQDCSNCSALEVSNGVTVVLH